MRVGSNRSIPEIIETIAEAIEEAVEDSHYATGCEIPEQPYVREEPTYNPGGYNQRCGYDQSSWMQSNLLKTLARGMDNARNESGQCYTVSRVYTDERGQKMAELSDPTGKSQPRPIPLTDMPGYQVAVG